MKEFAKYVPLYGIIHGIFTVAATSLVATIKACEGTLSTLWDVNPLGTIAIYWLTLTLVSSYLHYYVERKDAQLAEKLKRHNERG